MKELDLGSQAVTDLNLVQPARDHSGRSREA
jgi:hypothetical protein